MYHTHFGLTENPFSITPDPRFLFLSRGHREGIAHLLYGMKENGGFVQLTGEVGTGKTTLYRSVLDNAPKNVDIALILNPRQSATELLASICDELHVAYPPETSSVKTLIDALNEHLLKTYAQGRRTILIIDEAQDLDVGALEQIRLLTNLETSQHKLLRIVLVGQPELQTLLARPDLRQLAQRITARYHLTPLTAAESVAYVKHRLRRAGVESPLFTARALKAAHKLSGGIPRLINVICDRALIGAYAEHRDRIDDRLLRKAAAEVRGESTPRRWPWALAAGLAVLALCGAGTWEVMRDRPLTLSPSVAALSEVPPVRSDQIPEPRETVSEDPPLVESQAVDTSAPAATEPESATIPPAPKVASPSLIEILDRGLLKTDTLTAFTTLFAHWGQNYAALTGDGACERATSAGLSCVFGRGNLTSIGATDRPAVLELIDDRGWRHHVTLTRLDDTEATLDFGGEVVTLPREQLDSIWFGSYVLLWRPPKLQTSLLAEGSSGPDVRWLRAKLDQAAGVPVTQHTSPVFDAGLKQRVQAFQGAHGLAADGIVGRQTLLKLNSVTGDPPVPKLTPSLARAGAPNVVHP